MSKSGYWVPAEIDDKKIKYTYEKHSPIMLRGTPWVYCKYCGLVYLNNRFTKWCIKKGCNNSYHPEYRKTMNRLTSSLF